MALTDAWLKAQYNKERTNTLVKSDRNSIGVRVSPKGKITFQFRYKIDGGEKRVDLGVYPQTSLKEAREKAEKYRTELGEGHDPRQLKKEAIQKKRSAATFEEIFRQWHQSYCVENKKNHHEIMRSFEIYFLPKMGAMLPDRISTDQYLTLLEVVKESSPSISERLLINTKQLLGWAKRRGLVSDNPLAENTAKKDLSITKKRSFRSLSDDEISLMYEALYNSRVDYKNKIFVELCLLYGCRNGELRKAKRKDFDFNKMVWTVPPENHKIGDKTHEPLIRPIIPEIKEVLELIFNLAKSEYVFNNAGSDKPMGQAAPGSIPYNILQWVRKNKQIEMEHWSIHDLRKTARTNFSKITQPHIAEIMLGHSLPGEWRTYDRHDYLDEQAECLIKWGEKLDTFRQRKLVE